MPPQQNFNPTDQQNSSQAPPPRFGPTPTPPTFQPSPEPSVDPPAPVKQTNRWIIITLVALVVIGLAVALFYSLPQFFGKSTSSAQPTAEAVKAYSPSLVSMVKGSENWQNGRFEIEASHGLPGVQGTFVKTASGDFYTVADINEQTVTSSVQQLDQITPDHSPIYTGNEFQLDTLGLLNQIGYGMDINVLDFLEDLLADFGNPQDAPEFAACEADLQNYYGKSQGYLSSLKPNYVYVEKYESYQWSLNTVDLFNNLSVKANSPNCFAFLDKLLSSNVESDKLAGTQVIFEVTEESADGATFKLFRAPPVPSEDYEFIFKMKLTNVNKTQSPTSFASNPMTIFSRSSAFALSINQCGGLPLITQVIADKPVYITPSDTQNYKGPKILNTGYYCTEADAVADGYAPFTN